MTIASWLRTKGLIWNVRSRFLHKTSEEMWCSWLPSADWSCSRTVACWKYVRLYLLWNKKRLTRSDQNYWKKKRNSVSYYESADEEQIFRFGVELSCTWYTVRVKGGRYAHAVANVQCSPLPWWTSGRSTASTQASRHLQQKKENGIRKTQLPKKRVFQPLLSVKSGSY